MISKFNVIDSLADEFEDDAIMNEMLVDGWREEYSRYEIDIPEQTNLVEYF